ncbi:MAG TPA: RNA 2',3'-cyclic phosphodiesterase [Steroidobacteraceae bacterium]|nr:RNA 2',3'-cyclic phosphodiesterase [Steroidobacteraceae bacterium]
MKNRRLFFALWPTDAVRARLAAEVEIHAGLGRPIAARNLHVTVVFLGAVAEDRVADVRAAAKLTRIGKFMLHLERMEFWRRSNLIALTAASAPPQLLTIVDGLRVGLRERGFELREHDTFRPHVTLVRDVARGPAAAAVTPVQWPVESFALVESKVGQRGSEYTVLDEWPLA